MTLFGIDLSDYDWGRGPVDVAAMARDGISFLTHKSTEATWVTHAHYGDAMRRARDAGIPILGAYHVVRSPLNASDEVDFCLSYVDRETPWWRDFPHWFWQVDLEQWSYDAVPAREGEEFADIIEARTGRKAIIYASQGQYGAALTGTSHELWNANYGNDSAGHYAAVYSARGGDSGPGWVGYSGRMPVFWQFGAQTRIGSQNTCDANAFRGTLEQLRALISGGDMLTDAQSNTLTADTWRMIALLEMREAAEYQIPGEPHPRHEPNKLKAQLDTMSQELAKISAKLEEAAPGAISDEQLERVMRRVLGMTPTS